MARYINGRLINNSEDKRKAVEEAGGFFNELVEGSFLEGEIIEGDCVEGANKPPKSNPKKEGRNYVEDLGGKKVDGFM